ncbi:SpoIID/LytB domain-containing protein [bacterium BMS3Abin03]|jgi:SpoIID/LytB domain protein|nr:SpoIID/LytB domain-containing protein [bacterium BMS3Abin03]MCG6960059.1 SpoIID/LytB domain-containing protein [bacterium BMS3Abin03]
MLIREEPLLSVGILTDKKINFELYGNFAAAGYKRPFSGVFTAEVKEDVITCKSTASNLEVKKEIIFTPQTPSLESFLIKDVTIGVDFHWQRKERQRFSHSLKLLRDGDNIIIINILPLEDYLISVISSEMSAKGSIQSLKAQTVVARSWVLAQLEKDRSKKNNDQKSANKISDDEIIRWYGREKHKYFDVCADDHCQRFQGITKVTTRNAREAVEQTRGLVILSDNKICDARYSKSCGGRTENFENTWEPVKHSFLKSIIDYKYIPDNFDLDLAIEENARKWITGNPPAFCNTSDKTILSQILIDYDQETVDFFRWKVEYKQAELSSIIKEKSGIDFGDILDLIPVERGASARLIRLKIVGSQKTLTIGKELEIRRVLSKSHLYSSAFVVDKILDKIEAPVKFIIHGAGWGHGVGLCQIGGAVMAAQGYQFDEILLHYFSGAKIKKIY